MFIGNTAPSITDTIKKTSSSGTLTPLDLYGATVTFKMRSTFGSVPLISGLATIVGVEADGDVRYDWTLANTTTDIDSSPGPYIGWWHIDYGGGTELDTPEFEVFFHDHSPRRSVGPCTDWCTSQDVVGCYSDVAPGACLTSAVRMASEVLFESSARQFPGWCQSVIRPCMNRGCFSGGGIGPIQILERGHIVWTGFGWNDNGEPCQCGGWLQSVELPGVAQSVVEVLISGNVVSPTLYRLDPDNLLIRTDGSGWPICQNMNLDGDKPGTFQVTYQHGYEPTEIGRRAAAQLAREFYLACSNRPCKLPANVTKIARQGIEITKTAASMWKDGQTGLSLVDAFLNTYPQRKPVLVMSPETMPTDRRIS